MWGIDLSWGRKTGLGLDLYWASSGNWKPGSVPRDLTIRNIGWAMMLRQLRISPKRGKVWGKQKKRKRHRRGPGGSEISGKLKKRIYKREVEVRNGLLTGWDRVLLGWLRKPLKKKSGCSELIPRGFKQGRGGPRHLRSWDEWWRADLLLWF